MSMMSNGAQSLGYEVTFSSIWAHDFDKAKHLNLITHHAAIYQIFH